MKTTYQKNAGLLSIAGALALLFAIWSAILDQAETIDDWFIVDALMIEDYRLGEDPIIKFDRTILKQLSGQWSVETQQKQGERWVTVCRGFGLSHYSPDEALPPNGVTLNWFRDKCEDNPGLHRLQVVWQFTDPETGDTKARIVETDSFTVLE